MSYICQNGGKVSVKEKKRNCGDFNLLLVKQITNRFKDVISPEEEITSYMGFNTSNHFKIVCRVIIGLTNSHINASVASI